ncbi:MAG: DUF5666 domain-containing protein, partial [Burkholderiaceae bacterium]
MKRAAFRPVPVVPARPLEAPSPARRRTLLGLGALGALVTGCGGGTDVAGIGSGGTGTPVTAFSSGPISGFGSIIVNGIKYDDSAAAVLDDLGRIRRLSELGLGMLVEVEGTIDASTGLGVARSIRIVSQISGRVESIDAAARRFVSLGTVVAVDPATVWNELEGFDALVPGAEIEVWGDHDSEHAVLRASRVEIRTRPEVATKLRGTIAAVDAGAARIRIGAQWIDLRGLATVPAGLVEGMEVCVLSTNYGAGEPMRASEVATISSAVTAPVAEARVDGTVSRHESGALFRVGQWQVDGSKAESGRALAAVVRNGTRVRVTGPVRDGWIVARTVELRSVSSDPEPESAETDPTSAQRPTPTNPSANAGNGQSSGSGSG